MHQARLQVEDFSARRLSIIIIIIGGTGKEAKPVKT